MIYRGLVMTALEKGKKWGLDVLGSLYYLESYTLVAMVGS